jgi:hypothetical protein
MAILLSYLAALTYYMTFSNVKISSLENVSWKQYIFLSLAQLAGAVGIFRLLIESIPLLKILYAIH